MENWLGKCRRLFQKRVLAIVATVVLELWSFLVVVWFGSLLASSSLDCRKFLPKVLGGRPSLFWAPPVRA